MSRSGSQFFVERKWLTRSYLGLLRAKKNRSSVEEGPDNISVANIKESSLTYYVSGIYDERITTHYEIEQLSGWEEEWGEWHRNSNEGKCLYCNNDKFEHKKALEFIYSLKDITFIKNPFLHLSKKYSDLEKVYFLIYFYDKHSIKEPNILSKKIHDFIVYKIKYNEEVLFFLAEMASYRIKNTSAYCGEILCHKLIFDFKILITSNLCPYCKRDLKNATKIHVCENCSSVINEEEFKEKTWTTCKLKHPVFINDFGLLCKCGKSYSDIHLSSSRVINDPKPMKEKLHEICNRFSLSINDLRDLVRCKKCISKDSNIDTYMEQVMNIW